MINFRRTACVHVSDATGRPSTQLLSVGHLFGSSDGIGKVDLAGRFYLGAHSLGHKYMGSKVIRTISSQMVLCGEPGPPKDSIFVDMKYDCEVRS